MTLFTDLLNERGVLLCDGATGTNYFALGLETGHPPEFWALEKPELVLGLHQRFLDAGSDIILTNSFGGTSFRLKLHQAQDQVSVLNIAAAKLARQAADDHHAATGRKVLVAGSMGPTGELFAPLGMLDHAAAVAGFQEQANALKEGGADLLWIETISAIEEINAAFEAAASTGLPVVSTMTFDTAGKSMMGVNPDDYARHVNGLGVVAFGANCGVGPAELLHSVLQMKIDHAPVLIAKGNCGIPEYKDGAIHYHGSPELMAKYAILARDAGIQIIGGCCGTTPEHIKAMRDAIDLTPPTGDVTLDRVAAEIGQPWQGLDASKAQGSGDQGRGGASRRRRRRDG